MKQFANLPRLRSLVTVSAAAGMFASASCAPAVDSAAIGKALAQLDDEWAKAAAIKNVDSVASFYAATHTMVAVTGTDISAALGVRSWNATSMALLMRYE